MWGLSFMKLREILVGIIVGLFLAILFWSGDRYATQPKTGSDSGEFNLRLGFCCCCCCFFSEEHEISGYLPKKNRGQRTPWWPVRVSFIQVAGVESQGNFRIPSVGITMSTSKTFLVVPPQTQTPKTIVFLLPQPIVFDVNCCCQTGWSSCGCKLCATCCRHREAEIIATDGWGRIFSRVTRMGSQIFGFWG